MRGFSTFWLTLRATSCVARTIWSRQGYILKAFASRCPVAMCYVYCLFLACDGTRRVLGSLNCKVVLKKNRWALRDELEWVQHSSAALSEDLRSEKSAQVGMTNAISSLCNDVRFYRNLIAGKPTYRKNSHCVEDLKLRHAQSSGRLLQCKDQHD